MVIVEKKLGKKGQVQIPKIFTEQFRIRPGDKIILELVNAGILIRAAPKWDQVKTALSDHDDKLKVIKFKHSRLGELKGVSLEEEFDE